MAEEGSVQVELTVSLPGPLAREAEARGLLTSGTLKALIQAEVQRRRVEQLFATADRLAATATPPMSEAEVAAQIQAVRAERRAGRANSR